jgi:hypothetical protein
MTPEPNVPLGEGFLIRDKAHSMRNPLLGEITGELVFIDGIRISWSISLCKSYIS